MIPGRNTSLRSGRKQMTFCSNRGRETGHSPYQVFQDYTVPFLGETGSSTIIAGVVGVVVVLGVIILIGRSLGGTTKN